MLHGLNGRTIFILLPRQRVNPVRRFGTITLGPRRLKRISSRTTITRRGFQLNLGLFLRLYGVYHNPTLTIVHSRARVVILYHDVMSLNRQRPRSLPNGTRLRLQLLTTRRPPRLPYRLLGLFFLVELRRVVR